MMIDDTQQGEKLIWFQAVVNSSLAGLLELPGYQGPSSRAKLKTRSSDNPNIASPST
jgi:hypothetical protein